jgi:hypothetical protein
MRVRLGPSAVILTFDVEFEGMDEASVRVLYLCKPLKALSEAVILTFDMVVILMITKGIQYTVVCFRQLR